jgi:hypothetical protein
LDNVKFGRSKDLTETVKKKYVALLLEHHEAISNRQSRKSSESIVEIEDSRREVPNFTRSQSDGVVKCVLSTSNQSGSI